MTQLCNHLCDFDVTTSKLNLFFFMWLFHDPACLSERDVKLPWDLFLHARAFRSFFFLETRLPPNCMNADYNLVLNIASIIIIAIRSGS